MVDHINIDDFSHSSKGIFYESLSKLYFSSDDIKKGRTHFFLRIANNISQQNSLSSREKSDRIVSILSKIHLNDNELKIVVIKSHDFPTAIKNAIATFLPDYLRPLLYSKSIDELLSKESILPKITVTEEPELELKDQKLYDNSIVLLLSKGDNQTSNKKLLESNNFSIMIIKNDDMLENILINYSDVCSCIVDGSYLIDLNEIDQINLFKKLSKYSTFIWIRVDESQLKISHEKLQDIIKEERCSYDVSLSELLPRENGNIRHTELGYLTKAKKTLNSIREGKYFPGEINEVEALVLMAAATQYAKENKLSSDIEVTSLRTGIPSWREN